MFDVTKFNERKGWTIRDLARNLFGKGGESRVGMWKSGESNPRYEQILELIRLGATAEELFGNECASILLKNSSASNLPAIPSGFDTPEFRDGVKAALADLQKMGVIMDIGAKEKDGR